MNTTNEVLLTTSPLLLATTRTDLPNIRVRVLVQHLIMMALMFFVSMSFIPHRTAHAGRHHLGAFR